MNRRKLQALAATSRIANIPSVVSNVWVGIAIGLAMHLDPLPQESAVPWWMALRLVLAGICLYVSGNFLNDWMDRGWDARRRPERALPAGLFSPRLYRNTAIVLAVAGVALAASAGSAAGVIAAGIVGSVVIYTIYHKQSSWTVLAMGLCRGLLPILGAAGFSASLPDHAFVSAMLVACVAGTGLFCYIVGLSISARYESLDSQPHFAAARRGFLFSVPVLLPALYWFSSGRPSHFFLAGFLGYAAWLGVCHVRLLKPLSAYVSGLLAGIPLVDWILLAPISLAELSPHAPRFAVDVPGLASLAIPPLAFVSALILQRVAPAT